MGDQLERDSESVAKDIRWNLVTHEAAEEENGVVLNDGGEVDTEETEARREGLGTSGGTTLVRTRAVAFARRAA